MKAKPPPFAEKLISLLLPSDLNEIILGDFAEMFARDVVENGRFRATVRYWQQVLHSTPAFLRLNLTHQLERRWIPMIKSISKHEKQTFVIGILLLIPIMLISIPGVIYSAFGQAGLMNAVSTFLESNPILSLLIHPAIVIGGLLIAFILNAIPLFNIGISNQDEQIVGTIALRKGNVLQLIFVSICLLFGLVMFVYLLAENLQLFQAIR